MVEARQEELWAHTSSLMAHIANCNRTKKECVFKPADFNPLGGEGGKDRDVIHEGKNISALKSVFITNNPDASKDTKRIPACSRT